MGDKWGGGTAGGEREDGGGAAGEGGGRGARGMGAGGGWGAVTEGLPLIWVARASPPVCAQARARRQWGKGGWGERRGWAGTRAAGATNVNRNQADPRRDHLALPRVAGYRGRGVCCHSACHGRGGTGGGGGGEGREGRGPRRAGPSAGTGNACASPPRRPRGADDAPPVRSAALCVDRRGARGGGGATSQQSPRMGGSLDTARRAAGPAPCTRTGLAHRAPSVVGERWSGVAGGGRESRPQRPRAPPRPPPHCGPVAG